MNPPADKPVSRSILSNLTQSIQAFRSHREDVPLHMLVVFLLIAQRKGIGAAELGRLAGLSPASISRNVQALGSGKNGEPGLGLVAQIIDPKNPRAHSIRLTAKGVVLARDMVSAVNVQRELKPKPTSGGPQQPQATEHVHWQNWID